MKKYIYILLSTLLIATFNLSCTNSSIDGEIIIPEEIPEILPVEIVDGEYTLDELQAIFPSKKGACFTMREEGASKGGTYIENMPKVNALGVGWLYSWGTVLPDGAEVREGVEFMPMVWGSFIDDVEGTINPLKERAANGTIRTVFAFNEPDKEDQSNISEEDALTMWPYFESLGLPLVSPAPARALPSSLSGDDDQSAESDAWLDAFIAGVDEQGLRVDIIAIHTYYSANANNFKSKIQQVIERYKRPIIITEMAVADWTAATVADNKYTEDQVYAFMEEVLPWLEENENVLAYSWFPFSADTSVGCTSALFNLDGSYTKVGEYYANFKSYGAEGSAGSPDPTDPVITGDDESNILTNGNFETAGTSDSDVVGWSNNTNCIRAIDYFISGYASLRFGTVSASAEIGQKVILAAGQSYRLQYTGRVQQTYYEQGEATSGTTLTAYVMPASSSNSDEPDWSNIIATSSISDYENTTMQNEFTVTSTAEYYVWFVKNARIGYLDDVTLVIIDEVSGDDSSTTPETSSNLVSDPGFELGALGAWTLDSGNIAFDTTDSGLVISDSWSLRMTGKGEASISQSITVNPGTTYSFGFIGRILNSAVASGEDVYLEGSYITLSIANSDGDILGSLTIQSNYDTEVSGTLTIPEDITEVSITITKNGGIASIDDIFVEELARESDVPQFEFGSSAW